MFGSAILEVAVGVLFVILLLSMIASILSEFIASKLQLRAKNLEDGIRSLLGDLKVREDSDDDTSGESLVSQRLLTHPLIAGLAQRTRTGVKVRPPSYIPAPIFALALFDVIAPADPERGPVSNVRHAVAGLPDSSVRTALLTIIDRAGTDIEQARANVEGWFNDAMDRVSGWYKRRTQVILFLLGFALTAGLNVDLYAIAVTLYRSPAQRAAVVSAAEQVVAEQEAMPSPSPAGTMSPGAPSPSPSAPNLPAIRKQVDRLTELPLPVGWAEGSWPRGCGIPVSNPAECWHWLPKVLLWGIGALTVSLGAPFWFDVLSKFINLRLTGKRPQRERSGADSETAS